MVWQHFPHRAGEDLHPLAGGDGTASYAGTFSEGLRGGLVGMVRQGSWEMFGRFWKMFWVLVSGNVATARLRGTWFDQFAAAQSHGILAGDRGPIGAIRFGRSPKPL